MWEVNEDEYWERRREEFENPRAFHRRSEWDDWEDNDYEYEEDYLFLDEEVEDIEAEKGCEMCDLDEDDLLEIVEKREQIEAAEAEWNGRIGAIVYKYKIAS